MRGRQKTHVTAATPGCLAARRALLTLSWVLVGCERAHCRTGLYYGIDSWWRRAMRRVAHAHCERLESSRPGPLW